MQKELGSGYRVQEGAIVKTCNGIKLTKMEIELDLLVSIYSTLRK